jgi:hypothetical protein
MANPLVTTRNNGQEPCEVADLPRLFREAKAAEAATRREAMAANPMRQERFTTPEALAKFTAVQEKHRKLQERREELMRLMVTVSKQEYGDAGDRTATQ